MIDKWRYFYVPMDDDEYVTIEDYEQSEFSDDYYREVFYQEWYSSAQ